MRQYNEKIEKTNQKYSVFYKSYFSTEEKIDGVTSVINFIYFLRT